LPRRLCGSGSPTGFEVLDDVVRVEIELPWIMQLLGDTIAKRVRGRGVALLERPLGEA
jgi:hypothetical protein